MHQEHISFNTQITWELNLRVANIRSQKYHELNFIIISFHNIARKFDWTPDDNRIEKITRFLEWHGLHVEFGSRLFSLIWVTIFFEVLALLGARHCP